MKRALKRIPGGIKIIIAFLMAAALICTAGIAMLAFSPSAGANGAEVLRQVIGDQNVAVLETALFQVQDDIKQVEFHLGWIRPDNPFGQAPAQMPQNTSGATVPGKGSGDLSLPPVSAPLASIGGVSSAGVPVSEAPLLPKIDSKVKAAEASPVSRSTLAWMPGLVTPLGIVSGGVKIGEGSWQAYLQSPSGKTVAYRTFVQPDSQRPYALTGVVAFDLNSVRLHYVIGSQEPYAPGIGPKQPGKMPAADAGSRLLLAAFNGGFKFEHGHFGSMAGGFTSAPLLDGLGTVAIYKDGSVRIGQWGKGIQASPDLQALRQNGPLVIQDGKLTAQVDNESLWGRTIGSSVVTWRSGLAISADGSTLYYFAGPSLSIHSLANAMLAVHPAMAVQLDINNYWVHFVAVQSQNNQTVIQAMFPDVMRDNKDRFLNVYSRDFFYVTATK